MEVVVTSDIDVANEPLLALLATGGEKYIFRHLRYPETGGNASDIALIKSLCTTARELSEKELNKSLGQKTLTAFWTLDEAKQTEYYLDLPHGPISSVSSVKITYGDGSAATTLTANTDYYTFGNQYKKLKVASLSGTASSAVVNGYQVEYVAGYGASGCEALPDSLLAIMARQVAQWWAVRGEENASILSAEIRKGLMQFTRKSWL